MEFRRRIIGWSSTAGGTVGFQASTTLQSTEKPRNQETKKFVHEVVARIEEVVVTDVPEAEKPTENEVPPLPNSECKVEKAEKLAVEEVVEGGVFEENKITESASFKEESNKVDVLIDLQKKALDEFKLLIQEALNKHEFTAPPLPPAVKEEEKKPEEKKEEGPKTEEKKNQNLKKNMNHVRLILKFCCRQNPRPRDEAAVKLDESHYLFTLRVPSESNEIGDNILNYGMTIAAKGQEKVLRELDEVLEK
ncbi:patellin-3-like [Forsythia ovata]|uniref:Patellin-3-like n=1 Tax=Forsythia ovata TaxID=205694 RepID=A0ABD1SSD5_9LAMI